MIARNWFFYRQSSFWGVGFLVTRRSCSFDVGPYAFGWEWSWAK